MRVVREQHALSQRMKRAAPRGDPAVAPAQQLTLARMPRPVRKAAHDEEGEQRAQLALRHRRIQLRKLENLLDHTELDCTWAEGVADRRERRALPRRHSSCIKLLPP